MFLPHEKVSQVDDGIAWPRPSVETIGSFFKYMLLRKLEKVSFGILMVFCLKWEV